MESKSWRFDRSLPSVRTSAGHLVAAVHTSSARATAYNMGHQVITDGIIGDRERTRQRQSQGKGKLQLHNSLYLINLMHHICDHPIKADSSLAQELIEFQ